LATALLAVLACGGCHGPAGADGESRAEAKAQAATCASLLERRAGGPVAPVDPALFQQAMRIPQLANQSTAQVILLVCGQVAKSRGLGAP
jgi:hypothetical protein